jgi:threonine/homoserine/homoserine lactone efflux protein
MIDVEPKYEGWLNGPGMLLCCPICAATWVGASLLGLMALSYEVGYFTTLALSIGGAARLVIRAVELLEWQGRYAQERTAQLNRRNEQEEDEKDLVPFYNKSRKTPAWVVPDDERREED